MKRTPNTDERVIKKQLDARKDIFKIHTGPDYPRHVLFRWGEWKTTEIIIPSFYGKSQLYSITDNYECDEGRLFFLAQTPKDSALALLSAIPEDALARGNVRIGDFPWYWARYSRKIYDLLANQSQDPTIRNASRLRIILPEPGTTPHPFY